MWKYCNFCGNWESTSVCSVCNEDVYVSSSKSLKIPVYVNVNWSSNGELHLEQVYCTQVPWLADELNRKVFQIIKRTATTKHSIEKFSWWSFKEDIESAIQDSWDKTTVVTDGNLFELFIGLKVFLRQFNKPSFPWLFIKDFSKAVSHNASNLGQNDFKVDYGATNILENDYSLELFATSEQSVLVSTVNLMRGTSVYKTFTTEYFLEKSTRTKIVAIELDAQCLYELSMGVNEYHFLIYLRGKQSPFKVKFPRHSLRTLDVGDLYLDIGSTTTKFFVVSDGEVIQSQFKGTAQFFTDMSSDIYDKRHLLKSPDKWKSWIQQFLPKVRKWLLTSGSPPVYLRDLFVTIPVENDRKVKTFKSIEATIQKEQEDLLGSFQVHFEHKALENAYIPILKELMRQGSEYNEVRNAEQVVIDKKNNQKRKAYENAKAKREKYKSYGFFKKLFSSKPPKPSKPTYQRNTKQKLISSIQELLEGSDALKRVVILDAGGLSTDVSILESQSGQYQKLSASKSFVECGGEQLSSQIGRKKTGEAGTKYKMTLTQKYEKGLKDKKLTEYKTQTAVVYESMLDETFTFVRKKWGRKSFYVLTIGGGNDNPYLQELMRAKLDEHNLKSTVLTIRDFNSFISDAQSFGLHLSDTCTNFMKATNRSTGSYFPYSLVLGLWNKGGE